MHSADGKIPSGFITISLVSLRSPSLQAYYWKKCCFNKEQFQGWSTATNHRLGSLIYKSLVSERDAAECQVFTLLKALYDPLDQTPAAPGQRRIQGCLGKDPACISTGEVHVCVYIDARSQRRRGLRDEFLHFRRRFHLTATTSESEASARSTWANAAGQSHRNMWKVVTWLAVVFNRAVSDLPLGPETLGPCCTLQLNRSCQTPEPCVCSADRAPGAGKQQRARPSAPVWTFMKTRSQRSGRLKSTSFLCLYLALRSNKSAQLRLCTAWKPKPGLTEDLKKMCVVAAWRLQEDSGDFLETHRSLRAIYFFLL